MNDLVRKWMALVGVEFHPSSLRSAVRKLKVALQEATEEYMKLGDRLAESEEKFRAANRTIDSIAVNIMQARESANKSKEYIDKLEARLRLEGILEYQQERIWNETAGRNP